jgi:hypothetical protein
MPSEVKTKPDPNRPLEIGDECDQCGEAAFMRTTFVTGELLFCGHHGHKFLSQRSNAKGPVFTRDETYRLYED